MKDTARRWILIGSFALILAALAFILPVLLHRGAPKLSLSETRVFVTPEVTPEVESIQLRTPVPTPVPVVATPEPVYPAHAVNLLVNGIPLFTLDSREVAEQLVRIYLEECAYENLDASTVLRTAAIDADKICVSLYLKTEQYPHYPLARQAKIKRKNPPPCQLYWKTSKLVAGYKAYGDPYGIRTHECMRERHMS